MREEAPRFGAFWVSMFVAGAFSSAGASVFRSAVFSSGAVNAGFGGGTHVGRSNVVLYVLPLLISTVIGAYVFPWVLMQVSGRSISYLDAAVLIFVGALASLAFRFAFGLWMLHSYRPAQSSAGALGGVTLFYLLASWLAGPVVSYQVFRFIVAPARASSGPDVPRRAVVERRQFRANSTVLLWIAGVMLLGAAVFFVLAARSALS